MWLDVGMSIGKDRGIKKENGNERRAQREKSGKVLGNQVVGPAGFEPATNRL